MRRVPFGVWQEIGHQLEKMFRMGVIQPSKSSWASPVVLVRKKGGSLRFCIDYCKLNSVTKPDVSSMPRADDMLGQLGKSNYSSTFDLVSGYKQIRMDPDSQEKTTFVTLQGLHEFLVMSLGLMNAPATFQQMKQKLLISLNPANRPHFVSVDDMLILSEFLEEHIHHIQLVLDKLKGVSLKLKPTNPLSPALYRKESITWVIMSERISPNPARTQAVQAFPVPTYIRELRQFLGQASHSRA